MLNNIEITRCLDSYLYIDSCFVCLFQNGGAFLIQANTQKRQKIDNKSDTYEHVEVGLYLMIHVSLALA